MEPDRQPRRLLFTGNGKGKTTAALGMAMRACGHGIPVLVIQFIKSNQSTGELATGNNLPQLQIEQYGKGFVPAPDDLAFAGHRTAACRGMARAVEALSKGAYGLIVLDEVCAAVSTGLIDEVQVLELFDLQKPDTVLVLTGRNATARMIEKADTVTEMRNVRHGYSMGIAAEKGVEF